MTACSSAGPSRAFRSRAHAPRGAGRRGCASTKADKGYDVDRVYALLTRLGLTAHVRGRREEAWAVQRIAGFRARRWVVERTHSWLNRFRALLVRWDKTTSNYEGSLHLACAYIAFARTGLLG
jgi:putative transposase